MTGKRKIETTIDEKTYNAINRMLERKGQTWDGLIRRLLKMEAYLARQQTED